MAASRFDVSEEAIAKQHQKLRWPMTDSWNRKILKTCRRERLGLEALTWCWDEVSRFGP